MNNLKRKTANMLRFIAEKLDGVKYYSKTHTSFIKFDTEKFMKAIEDHFGH